MINQNQFILLSFGKTGGHTLADLGGVGLILGENPAGHCFVLRNL